MPLELTTERDVTVVSLQGETLEVGEELAAPQETAMHLAVYRHRPEVASVIHADPD